MTVPESFPSDDRFAAISVWADGSLQLTPLQSAPVPEHFNGADVSSLLFEPIWASNGTRAFVRDTGHHAADGKIVIICGAGRSTPFSGSECLVDFTAGVAAPAVPAPSAGRQPSQVLTEPLFQSAIGRVGVSHTVHLEVADLFEQQHQAIVNGTEKEWIKALPAASRIHLTPYRDETFARFLKAMAVDGALPRPARWSPSSARPCAIRPRSAPCRLPSPRDSSPVPTTTQLVEPPESPAHHSDPPVS